MSVRTDVINLQVNVNNNQAQNQLNELRKKAKEIAFEMDGLKKGTQEYIDKKAQLKHVTAEMDGLKKQIGLTALSQKELNAELNKLKALRGSTVPFTKEFKDFSDQIAKVESRLYDVKNGVQGFASFFSKIKDEVKQFGLLAVSYLGFQFVTQQFQNIIRGAGQMSDQLAAVRKTTGLTAEEVKNLNKQLQQIDTRTPNAMLRDLAKEAGKLGITGTENVLAFVRAADQIKVALGEDLGEDAITKVGKLVNVFRLDEKFGLEEAILKTGSAINELGAASAASEGYIVDFTARMAGIAPTAKISVQDVAALGATLDELAITSELGSTAIGNTISKLVTDFKGFADIAGISEQKLRTAFKNDGALEALKLVLNGVQKSSGGFDVFISKLGDVGVEGSRAKSVFGALAGNLDKLTQNQLVSNAAFDKGKSITEEFGIQNETFGATLDKLSKEFNKLVTSPGMINFLKGAVEGIFAFVKALRNLPQFISENKVAVLTLVAGILLLNRQYIVSAALIIRDTAVKIANSIATRGGGLATAFASIATASYITITNLLTGRITLATAAQRLWNIALSVGLGPLGILLTVIGAVAVALGGFSGKLKEVSIQQQAEADLAKKSADAYGDQVNRLELLKKILTSSTSTLDEKKKAQEELIKINPDFINTLKLDADGHLKGVDAIDAYILKLKEKARVQAATELSNDLNKQQLQLERALEEANKITPKKASLLDNIFGSISEEDVKKAVLEDANSKLGAIKQAKKYYDDIIEKAIRGDATEVSVTNTTTVTDKTKDKKDKKSNKAEENKLEQLRKDAEAFAKELKKIKAEADRGTLSDYQREVALVEEKYRELLDRAKKYWVNNTALEKQQTEQIVAIRNAQLEQLMKKQLSKSDEADYGNALKKLDNYFDAERNARGREYAAGKLTKKEYESELTFLEATENKSRIVVALQYSQVVKKAAADITIFQKKEQEQQTKDAIKESEERKEKTVNEILAAARLRVLLTRKGSKEEHNELKKEIEDKWAIEKAALLENLTEESDIYKRAEEEKNQAIIDLDKARIDAQIEQVQRYANYFVTALTSLNQIITNKENKALQQEKARNNEKKKSLKNALDNKLISQAQYDKKLTELQEEQDRKERELKRKQAKREKALNIFRAIVNVAAGVASSLSSGGPVGIALAAITAVLGALEIAAIASAPLPELGKGGMIDNGPQHSDSEKGLHLVDPKTGRTEMLLEKGEGVLSKKTMESNTVMTVTGTPKQIASGINAANGGASFASGAMINYKPMWMKQPQQTIKPGIVTMMAQGGVIGGSNTGGDDGFNTAALMQMQTAEIQALRKDMQSWQTKIKGQWVIKDLDDTRKLYDDAKKASSIKQ